MPIPPQYPDFNHWMAATIGALSHANTEYIVWEKYWSSLSNAQHTAVKTSCVSALTAAIVEFQAMIVHVQSVPS